MLWIVLAASFVPVANCVQCMSQTGSPVDWFIVYKLPSLRENGTHSVGRSVGASVRHDSGHFYMDVNNPTWTLSKVLMKNPKHAVYNTLQTIYQAKTTDDFAYVMYNDKTPAGKEPESDGHSKGVFAFDKEAGFWLVHSTPGFPPNRADGYNWPDTALVNGQSFLCVSYSYSQLNNIASQIVYNYVQVYDHMASASFLSDNPSLAAVINHKHPGRRTANKVQLTSKQGTPFLSFAKTAAFNDDLYSAFVAPVLQSGLMTETWQDGVGKMPSDCSSSYKVYNVKAITLPNGIDFKETKDHSKWAVSMTGNWACIGDINRQLHQMKRGGGTVCLQNEKVWSQFNSSVKAYEHC
ncbi:plancitoxin-1-like [Haliotis rufescens]|uniref:plancitoxin-1-like n=1 Tax=Haliotis rufescens TaxID=6454 RepID=UPI00201F12D7|nr:plancitoxin-1-like [Haliotis rufescens]